VGKAVLRLRIAATFILEYVSVVGAGMGSNPIRSHFADIPRG